MGKNEQQVLIKCTENNTDTNLSQDVKCLAQSRTLSDQVQLFSTLGTGAHQAPLFMGFSRQEYWSGLPFPPPMALSNPGIEPASLMTPTLVSGLFTTSATWEIK